MARWLDADQSLVATNSHARQTASIENRRTSMAKELLATIAAAILMTASPGPAQAQEREPIVFGAAEDFTGSNTFVSIEYSQGQRDYVSLVNAHGGIDGHPVHFLLVNTGNDPARGIAAYDRFREQGAVMMDFLSTPVMEAILPQARLDGMNILSLFHGRPDTIDGTAYPNIFPMSPSYWSQAALLVRYLEDQAHGDIRGKKIALVGLDSPFGRAPASMFDALASRLGFAFRQFLYPSAAASQQAIWAGIEDFVPDWIIFWGAAGGQVVSLQNALGHGVPMERVLSAIWMSETDMNIVGAGRTSGITKFEGVASGKDFPVIRAIEAEIVDKHLGAGSPTQVGSTYYNIGVASMALFVEGARKGLAAGGGHLTVADLRAGLDSIKDYTAEGLMPPTTITTADHQGGGLGRIAKWDGMSWVAQTGWQAAYQDLMWDLVRRRASPSNEPMN
jgi:branched-chain amino acid transport system substrate-binding protein